MVKRTTAAKRVVTTMFSAFLQREGIWRWRRMGGSGDPNRCHGKDRKVRENMFRERLRDLWSEDEVGIER